MHSAAMPRRLTTSRSSRFGSRDKLRAALAFVFRIPDALHFDRAVIDHSGQRANGGKNRSQNRANHTDAERELRDSVTALLDDHPPHVTLVHQLPNRINELSAGDLDRFFPGVFTHDASFRQSA